MLIAISLIPYTYYALVIKSTIRKKSSVVTISYISPSMEELEKEIDEAGITVMNEIGLDQGHDPLFQYILRSCLILSQLIFFSRNRSPLLHRANGRGTLVWRKDYKL